MCVEHGVQYQNIWLKKLSKYKKIVFYSCIIPDRLPKSTFSLTIRDYFGDVFFNVHNATYLRELVLTSLSPNVFNSFTQTLWRFKNLQRVNLDSTRPNYIYSFQIDDMLQSVEYVCLQGNISLCSILEYFPNVKHIELSI